jgi:hypothetical protein
LPLKQFLRALQLNCSQRLSGFAALNRTLGLPDGGFEQAVFDPIKRLADGDRAAFLKQNILEIASNPRPDIDALYRVDASAKVHCLFDSFAGSDNRSDGKRGWFTALRPRTQHRRAKKKNNTGINGVSHGALPVQNSLFIQPLLPRDVKSRAAPVIYYVSLSYCTMQFVCTGD